MEPIWANYTLIVSLRYIASYVMDSGDEKGSPYGLQGSLFTSIVDSMGLKWEKLNEEDNVWGSCYENGTCIGQLKSVIEGRADIALGPVLYSNALNQYLRPTHPLHTHLVLISGFPNLFKPPDMFAIVKVFPPMVWMLMGVALLMIPQLSYRIGSVLPHEVKLPLFDHYQAVLENLFMESSKVTFQSYSLRIVFCAWLLSSSVLGHFMNATLKSVMTLREGVDRIESIHDILKRDPKYFKVTIMSGTDAVELLQEAEFVPYNRLADYIMKSDGLIPASEVGSDELVRDIESGKKGILFPCEFAKGVIHNPPSRARGYITCSREHIITFLIGWVTPRKASKVLAVIVDEMHRRLLWMRESPTKLLPDHILDPEVESVIRPGKVLQQSEATPLTLETLFGCFVILAIGMVSGFITLVFECLIKIISTNSC